MVKLAKSKMAEDLHDIIMKLLEAKGLDSSLIRFSGLDRTNAMNGERKGLQRLIQHTSPYAQYLNCKNRRLALCWVQLIQKYQKLTELDSLLISLWKTFRYSSIKQSNATGFKTVKNHKGMRYEMAYPWRVLHTTYRKVRTSS